jgi:hypothetical protein
VVVVVAHIPAALYQALAELAAAEVDQEPLLLLREVPQILVVVAQAVVEVVMTVHEWVARVEAALSYYVIVCHKL